jgi:hypothetical protein
MRWLLILVLATGAAPAAPPMPGFFEAPELVSACSGDSLVPDAARATCLGYVVGAFDQLMAMQSTLDAAERTICPPKVLTVYMVLQAIDRHAVYAVAAKGVGAAGFVRFALEDAYPCHVRSLALAPARSP